MAAAITSLTRLHGMLTLCIGTGTIGFFNVGLMAEQFGVAAALAIISVEGFVALLALRAWGGSGPSRAPGTR